MGIVQDLLEIYFIYKYSNYNVSIIYIQKE